MGDNDRNFRPTLSLEEIPCPLCGRFQDNIAATGWDFEYATCKNEFTFQKCEPCDIIYLSPRPSVSELGHIYPSQYNAFNFHRMKNPFIRYGRRTVQGFKLKAIEAYLKSGARVMDIGSGSGTLLSMLEGRGKTKYDLWVNDIDQSPIQSLKELGISVAVGRFEEVELPEKSFDLLIFNQIIEHVSNVQSVVQKAFQLLKPGGIVFVETPCLKGLDYKIFKRRYWGGLHIPRHWILFTEKSLTNLFIRNNFTLEYTKYLASPSFWIQSCHHFFLENMPTLHIHKLCTIKNPAVLVTFTLLDTLLARFRYTSNIRAVFRRPL